MATLLLSALSQLSLLAFVLARPAADETSTSTPTQHQRLHARQSTTTDVYGTRFANVSWNNANWQLSTTVLDQGHYQSRMAVANGYIGINVAALGPFFEVDTPVDGDDINGWPLFQRRQTFATVGGFFDAQPTTNGTNYPWLNQYGAESVISGIPHWSAITLDLGDGHILNASTDHSQISNFSTMLDMKQGLMNWAFTWTPSSSMGSVDITYRLFAHKLYINQALTEMTITASEEMNATVLSILDGTAAVRTNFTAKGTDSDFIYSAVNPVGIENVTAFVYAGLSGSTGFNASSARAVTEGPMINGNESSIAQVFDVQLSAGSMTTVSKFVGIASSDGYKDPRSVARMAATTAMRNGFKDSLTSHSDEWATILTPDSVDDYTFPSNGSLPEDDFIVEQAITAVTNPYYLLQNTIGENALKAANNASINSHSISVGGLASDSYAGLVFWDAEIWMQPGLVAAFPQAAQGIANYRVERLPQARANVKTSYQSSKNDTTFTGGAVFSWTSGRFGNCTGTGPCFDYEYHINGDIAQELANYWIASGDTATFQDQYFPVYDDIAFFYSEVVSKNGSRYSLTNMTDPDEYANQVDNGGFTMPLIADTLNNANRFRSMFGMEQNASWSTIAENVNVGRNADANIILEYTGMNGSIDVKQADVVLVTFPLRYENNYTQQDSLSDLDYYAAKQSPNGPGMTYAIFSIVANEVSPSGCSSYTYQQYSTHPYARAPWFQFSEQLVDDYSTNGGTHPAYPFLTGHGGANQVTIFGYLGLRFVPDFHLYVDPSLPPQIPQLKYRTIYWQGWPISAYSNATHTTLTRLGTPYAAANMTYATAPISVVVGGDPRNETTFSLAPNSTLTLVNRQIGQIATVAGNMFQCSRVTSLDTFEPGQFPISAVDGAASTKWQPSSANATASITVAFPRVGERINAVYFDWGTMPPATFSIILHNGSSQYEVSDSAGSAVQIANSYEVHISSPFNLSATAEIGPPTSNTSSFAVTGELYSADYATLLIRGNQAYGMNDTARFNASAPGGSVAEFAIIGDGGSALLGKRGEGQSNMPLLRDQREEAQWGSWLREMDVETRSTFFAGETRDVNIGATLARERSESRHVDGMLKRFQRWQDATKDVR